MKSNIDKVAERGERIDDLQDKTGEFDTSQLVRSHCHKHLPTTQKHWPFPLKASDGVPTKCGKYVF